MTNVRIMRYLFAPMCLPVPPPDDPEGPVSQLLIECELTLTDEAGQGLSVVSGTG